MATTIAQQKAVAIAPKFTAAASAISSAITIFLITCRGNKKQTYHRLVLGMSICDLSASIAWFFTTWPIPRGTPGVYGAVGNQQTCSAQAFFAQFSISTVMYNASLAIYYVLVIVKGWFDDDIVKIEPLLHGNAIVWGLGTALASLGLNLFNQVGWDCWISAAPLGCQESWNSPDGTTTCARGDNGSLYQWAFYYAPLWFVIILVPCLLYCVYHDVKTQENKVQQYRTSPSTTATVSNHKRIAGQAAAYTGAFIITWFFPTIFQLVIVTSQTFPFPLLFLTAFFVPIQGVFILITFIRPAYIRYRVANPDQFFLGAWFRVLRQELGKRNDNRSNTNTSSV
mmetsp:Transcript_30691/g.55627  ORF Transcript_30691/g.55627 Transcript_30691/m.55627 type:complete len:340 (-) Transcript_30691:3940-4959(-)